MHVIKREEKDNKRKRNEGKEERMNKSHKSQKSLYLYQTSEHCKYFPTVQPLEFNSHLSHVNTLPIN